jgi:hypothetical protein
VGLAHANCSRNTIGGDGRGLGLGSLNRSDLGASAKEIIRDSVMGYVGVKSSLLIALQLASGELWDRSEMRQVCVRVTS